MVEPPRTKFAPITFRCIRIKAVLRAIKPIALLTVYCAIPATCIITFYVTIIRTAYNVPHCWLLCQKRKSTLRVDARRRRPKPRSGFDVICEKRKCAIYTHICTIIEKNIINQVFRQRSHLSN